MNEQRIQRLQTLLQRIQRKAAQPRTTAGQKFVLRGTESPRTDDVAAGPSVPASLKPLSSPMAAPPTASELARIQLKPLTTQPAQSDVVQEIQAPPSPSIEPQKAAPAADAGGFDFEERTTHQMPSSAPAGELSWSEPPQASTQAQEAAPADSSRRPRVAASIDEALAEATGDSETEIPIKTPPPESGRQPTEGPYTATAPGALASPTAEQLGETLELEEPTSEEIELDLIAEEEPSEPEELEVELPARPSMLELPDESATAEGEIFESAHRAPEHSQVLATPDEIEADDIEEVDAEPTDNTLLSDPSRLALSPEVTVRTQTNQYVPLEVLSAVRNFAPRSFVELLDASLKL
jgi:hypothetical protein